MTPELERQLCADSPATFRGLAKRTMYQLDEIISADLRDMELVQAFGIECGDGWYGLIRRLAAKIEPWCAATGDHAVQVKEKYATLRFYMAEGTELGFRLEPRGSLTIAPAASSKEVQRAIDDAEEESARTCETCGAPGSLRDHGEWLSTRCDSCDDPAKRFVGSIVNIERILKYVIHPKTPEEARAWREVFARKFGRD